MSSSSITCEEIRLRTTTTYDIYLVMVATGYRIYHDGKLWTESTDVVWLRTVCAAMQRDVILILAERDCEVYDYSRVPITEGEL